jgi:hypothetical protein
MKEEIIEKLEQMKKLFEEEIKIYDKQIPLCKELIDLMKMEDPCPVHKG